MLHLQTLPWAAQPCRATRVPQSSHFLSPNHVPSPLLIQGAAASKQAPFVLSSKTFLLSLPGTGGFLQPFFFFFVPIPGDILCSAAQMQGLSPLS